MSRRAARRFLAVLVLVLAVPFQALAQVDTTCLGTAAVSGTVKDSFGAAVGGVTVELYPPNSVTVVGSGSTGTTGAYKVCGKQHDTWDVHVEDHRQPPVSYPKYADRNQPYTSLTNQGPLDFTPTSGFPLLYKLNLTVTPMALKSNVAPVFSFVVRTKMPFPSGGPQTVKLTYRKADDFNATPITIPVAQAGTESGPGGPGPDGGGWNKWTGTLTLATNYADTAFYAFAEGVDSITGASYTEEARQAFFVDNKLPIWGASPTPPPPGNGTPCGTPSSLSVGGFSPYNPTTNLKPIISHGVCDNSIYGSGLDPFSAVTKICPAPVDDSSCTTVTPYLKPTAVEYSFPSPLPYGATRYIKWTISDKAGNLSSYAWDVLSIVATCEAPNVCNRPDILYPGPANLGSGSTLGIVQGCSSCTPTSVPKITFKIIDADGPEDVNQGSLHIKIYYQTEQSIPTVNGPPPGLVYDFDPALDPNQQPTLTNKSGGATIQYSSDQSLYVIVTGYPLFAKPSGRYIVSAQVSDHGGNSSDLTWQFVLVTAA
jgi:hypothetical protein